MYRILTRIFLTALIAPVIAGCARHLEDCNCEVDEKLVRLDMNFNPASFIHPFMQDFDTSADPTRYELRFIIDIYAWNDGADPTERLQRVVRYVNTIDDGTVELSIMVPAEKVRVLVWSDFVVSGERTDLYYDTENLRRVTVKEPPRWGDPHKAGFEGQAEFDPAAMTDVSNVVEVPMELPMACYQIITNDVQQYSALAGVPGIGTLQTDVACQLWFPWSYDTYTGQVVEVKTGVNYTAPVNVLTQSEAVLASDFVFVARQVKRGPYDANLVVDFRTHDPSATVALWNDVEIGLIRGQRSEWRAPWLTSSSGAGIVVDPGFGGDIPFPF